MFLVYGGKKRDTHPQMPKTSLSLAIVTHGSKNYVTGKAVSAWNLKFFIELFEFHNSGSLFPGP